MNSCQEFRSLLEHVLERGSPAERALPELAWHEHLLACGECRALLEAEEALEILLATLPEPNLPRDLARRVVSRLRDARQVETRLDALLELDTSARAPAHLARSVLAGLASARVSSGTHELERMDAALDRLLELDRRVDVPSDLARHVLSNLRESRDRELVSTHAELGGASEDASHPSANVSERRFVLLRSPWTYAAAAGILAACFAWVVWQHAETSRRDAADLVARFDAPPDTKMLEALDVLEQWELLKSEDVDVLLSSSIGPVDEALLEFHDAEAAAPAPNEKEKKETEPPSKG